MTWHAIVKDVSSTLAGGIPAEVKRHASLVLADTVCAMIAGGREPELAAVTARMNERQEAEIAVPGARRLAAEAAATVNAMAAVWLEIDEDSKPGGHVAAQVLPAVLAVAQRDQLPGSRTLAGFVAGYEVAAALYSMFELPYPVHPHGLFGAVGAAVGCAVALGENPDKPARIASTLMPIGVWDPCIEGATSRHVLAGDAARTGVQAVDLANSGITGSATTLGSIVRAFRGRVRRPRPEHAGRGWEYAQITRCTFKLHSACLHAHAAIDATLEARVPDVSAIREITVTVSPRSAERIGALPMPNSLSTRFSLPYAVAAALAHGEASIHSMGFDPRVMALARRVKIVIDERYARAGEPIGGAKVTIATSDGARTAWVDRPRGVCDNPLNESELQAKFVDIVAGPRALEHYHRVLGAFDRLVIDGIFACDSA